MRRFIFILMIALLPLRGWMGDAMAYGMVQAMAQQGLQAAQAISSDATFTEANNDHMALTSGSNSVNIENMATPALAAHPCHSADTPSATSSTDAPVSNACTVCQVCHLTASLPQPLCTLLQARSSTLAAQPPLLWASADLSVLTKPPVL